MIYILKIKVKWIYFIFYRASESRFMFRTENICARLSCKFFSLDHFKNHFKGRKSKLKFKKKFLLWIINGSGWNSLNCPMRSISSMIYPKWCSCIFACGCFTSERWSVMTGRWKKPDWTWSNVVPKPKTSASCRVSVRRRWMPDRLQLSAMAIAHGHSKLASLTRWPLVTQGSRLITSPSASTSHPPPLD